MGQAAIENVGDCLLNAIVWLSGSNYQCQLGIAEPLLILQGKASTQNDRGQCTQKAPWVRIARKTNLQFGNFQASPVQFFVVRNTTSQVLHRSIGFRQLQSLS